MAPILLHRAKLTSDRSGSVCCGGLFGLRGGISASVGPCGAHAVTATCRAPVPARVGAQHVTVAGRCAACREDPGVGAGQQVGKVGGESGHGVFDNLGGRVLRYTLQARAVAPLQPRGAWDFGQCFIYGLEIGVRRFLPFRAGSEQCAGVPAEIMETVHAHVPQLRIRRREVPFNEPFGGADGGVQRIDDPVAGQGYGAVREVQRYMFSTTRSWRKGITGHVYHGTACFFA